MYRRLWAKAATAKKQLDEETAALKTQLAETERQKLAATAAAAEATKAKAEAEAAKEAAAAAKAAADAAAEDAAARAKALADTSTHSAGGGAGDKDDTTNASEVAAAAAAATEQAYKRLDEARKEAAAAEAGLRAEIASLNGKLAQEELKASSVASELAAAKRATQSDAGSAAAAAAAAADAQSDLIKLRAELQREKTRAEQGVNEARSLKARVEVAEAEVAEARNARAADRAAASGAGARLTSAEEIAHMEAVSAAQRRVTAAQDEAADAESAARRRVAKAEATAAAAEAEAAAALDKARQGTGAYEAAAFGTLGALPDDGDDARSIGGFESVADADEMMTNTNRGASTAWEEGGGGGDDEASSAAGNPSKRGGGGGGSRGQHPPSFSQLGAAIQNGDPQVLLLRARRFLKDQRRFIRERQIVIERTREEWRSGHAALAAEQDPDERERRRGLLAAVRGALDAQAAHFNNDARNLRALKAAVRSVEQGATWDVAFSSTLLAGRESVHSTRMFFPSLDMFHLHHRHCSYDKYPHLRIPLYKNPQIESRNQRRMNGRPFSQGRDTIWRRKPRDPRVRTGICRRRRASAPRSRRTRRVCCATRETRSTPSAPPSPDSRRDDGHTHFSPAK